MFTYICENLSLNFMDLIQYLAKIIRKNLYLLVALVILAGIGGIVHSNFQKIRYVSKFTTTKGMMDYDLLRVLVSFKSINPENYLLEENEIASIKSSLNKFSISYVDGSTNSINFTLSTEDKIADHSNAQDNIIRLLNSNKFIKNSVQYEAESLNKKRAFLEDKISLLDSVMTRPVNDQSGDIGSNALNSYTLFEHKVEIEKMISLSGTFEVIKPVISVQKSQKPVILFLGLYEVLALILFALVSKKKFTD